MPLFKFLFFKLWQEHLTEIYPINKFKYKGSIDLCAIILYSKSLELIHITELKVYML